MEGPLRSAIHDGGAYARVQAVTPGRAHAPVERCGQSFHSLALADCRSCCRRAAGDAYVDRWRAARPLSIGRQRENRGDRRAGAMTGAHFCTRTTHQHGNTPALTQPQPPPHGLPLRRGSLREHLHAACAAAAQYATRARACVLPRRCAARHPRLTPMPTAAAAPRGTRRFQHRGNGDIACLSCTPEGCPPARRRKVYIHEQYAGHVDARLRRHERRVIPELLRQFTRAPRHINSTATSAWPPGVLTCVPSCEKVCAPGVMVTRMRLATCP